MNKMNIIQFLPYFPPHKGGLETHSEEWAFWWVKKGYGEVINLTFDVGQQEKYKNGKVQKLKSKRDKIIGYEENGIKIYLLPAFDLIPNFPFPKFWKKEFFEILEIIKKAKSKILITRTRFFISSLLGGFFAKGQKIKWCHIEHGSDYVKLNTWWKNFIARIYDRTIGKWIFKNADILVGISQACKNFIQGSFVNKDISVIYRGIDLKKIKVEKIGKLKLVFIGRLVKLKGLDLFLKAFLKIKNKINLEIIGDGEEKEYLEKFCGKLGLENVQFMGFKEKEFISNYLARYNCILVNPSFQEGLPSNVIEGLFYGNVVLASDVGGTSEISNKNDLILFKSGNEKDLEEKLIFAIENFEFFKGKSKKEVEEKFNWDKNIDKYLEVLGKF